jgi:hypothetical protein
LTVPCEFVVIEDKDLSFGRGGKHHQGGCYHYYFFHRMLGFILLFFR